MNKEQVIEIFTKSNALLSGHFLLTSGRHSNQYFQCAQVLQYPVYTSQICTILADFFKEYEIDTIIAPAMGGIIVGQEVARQLNKKFIFAEREDKILTIRRGFTVSEGEKFLVCEDVVTTGGSVFETMDIVKSRGGVVVGVGVIVDRSNGAVDFGVPQKSTLQLEAVSFTPEECPLCKQGLEIVKPGSRKIGA